MTKNKEHVLEICILRWVYGVTRKDVIRNECSEGIYGSIQYKNQLMMFDMVTTCFCKARNRTSTKNWKWYKL